MVEYRQRESRISPQSVVRLEIAFALVGDVVALPARVGFVITSFEPATHDQDVEGVLCGSPFTVESLLYLWEED